MPDLWKALGDVYGDGQADAPPVRHEPAASERAAEAGGRFGTALPLDDDLAAALSAALVNAPTPGPETVSAEAVTPFVGPSPIAAPPPLPAPVPLTSPAALATPPVAAAPPVAFVPTAPPAPPAPAVPVPPAGEVQGRVTTWIAEIEDRNRRREEGPDLAAAVATGPSWSRLDDDIIPAAARKRRFRK